MNKQKLSVSLTPSKLEMLRRYAEETGVPLSAVVSFALDKYFRDNGTFERYEIEKK